jgi:hypothetical protein
MPEEKPTKLARGLCSWRHCRRPRATWIARGGYRSPFCDEHSARARITQAGATPRWAKRRNPAAGDTSPESAGAQRLVYDAKEQRMVLLEK